MSGEVAIGEQRVSGEAGIVVNWTNNDRGFAAHPLFADRDFAAHFSSITPAFSPSIANERPLAVYIFSCFYQHLMISYGLTQWITLIFWWVREAPLQRASLDREMREPLYHNFLFSRKRAVLTVRSEAPERKKCLFSSLSRKLLDGRHLFSMGMLRSLTRALIPFVNLNWEAVKSLWLSQLSAAFFGVKYLLFPV